ncbi:MAG: CaiB/BaiF CoA-transferase family protein [Paracoccaceae bacterium]|jgi:crotonobetainyl-CoA:carnitine CoA-transferase CaiB-like acyl-CoA transferase|nr:CoA transferase [Paracoccaceae bacterium]MDG1372316.1 CaiB/BaiF CoA-transferase family protein [Paracoccaceae bacterium]MDG1971841.1 CaiB/BaiF CoA-transferase family protein [Paracoccaceae bacterium]
MAKPLDGVLVVALEQAVAAPLCTARLAEAGARVIKIERPEGDFARGYDKAANGVSSYFAWLNQGKESIALDLRDPDDMALMQRLVKRADVFVQNLAFGAAGRLGLGADDLRTKRPELIYCSVSGFGSHGPYADRKAYDLLMQAESGIVATSGGPGEMGRVGASVADIGTGINAFGAISAALVRQARTREGAEIEVALFDTLAEWMTVPLLHHDYGGKAPGRIGLAHPSIAPYGAFETADGNLVLISIQSDREWKVLAADVLEDAALGDDPRFATNNARVTNRAATDEAVGAAFRRMTTPALRSALDTARIAYGQVNEVADLSNHPHLRRFDVATEVGTARIPASASQSDWTGPARAPGINSHGTAIRAEFSET